MIGVGEESTVDERQDHGLVLDTDLAQPTFDVFDNK
jgi:hypothetical protein